MSKISTTKIAKKIGKETKEVFNQLSEQKLVFRKDNQWILTKKGQEYGGELIESKKYGDYIVWPEIFNPFEINNQPRAELISVTEIGKNKGLSAKKVNLLFVEIGWIEQAIKGWTVTPLGKKIGGVQMEHTSGAYYAMWPKEILNNNTFLRSLNSNEFNKDKKLSEQKNQSPEGFREKFPATLRTKDGHIVRSRGEIIIDNALYEYGLAHAYERMLPIENDVYSDFYIPSKNGGKAVYIEYWGIEDDPKYKNRKEIKRNLYKDNELNLIELENHHIENLDDHLPRMLLKFGIKVE